MQMKKAKRDEKLECSGDSFWSEGSFSETMTSQEMKEKMKTLHEQPNDEKNFNCKTCNARISAHNQDWHAGMCDDCFNKKYFPDTVRK